MLTLRAVPAAVGDTELEAESEPLWYVGFVWKDDTEARRFHVEGRGSASVSCGGSRKRIGFMRRVVEAGS